MDDNRESAQPPKPRSRLTARVPNDSHDRHHDNGRDAFDRGGPLGTATILRLQRSAGNDAVVELLRRTNGARPRADIARTPMATRSRPYGVVQRVVTASSFLGPATKEELGERADVTEAPVPAVGLRVDAVRIPGGIRPPTSIKGSQGRHTVAWAARVREWAKAFCGPLPDVVKEVGRRAVDDYQYSPTAAYKSVVDKASGLCAATDRPESEWVQQISELITEYIGAYQTSEFAVFKSTNPKGKGEADHIAKLQLWSSAVDVGQRLDVSADVVVGHARGLLDVHGSMDRERCRKVVADWLRMLIVVFPGLFKSSGPLTMPGERLVGSIAQHGTKGIALVEAALAGHHGIDLEDDELESDDTAGDAVMAEDAEAEPVVVKTEEEAAEEAAEEEAVAGRTVDEAFGTKSYVVSVSLVPATPTPGSGSGPSVPTFAAFAAGQLRVRKLDIANERAVTRCFPSQGNHVMPWSLERVAYSREFVGKSLAAAFESLHARLVTHHGVPKVLPATATVGQWTSRLDRLVEEVITTEQASEGATFPGEADSAGKSNPTGHGEAVALYWLAGAEQKLKSNQAEGLPSQIEAKRWFRALVDLPQLDVTRERMGYGKARELEKVRTEWKRKLAVSLPKVCAAYGKAMDAAFNEADEPLDYFLVVNEARRLDAKIKTLTPAGPPRQSRRLMSRPDAPPRRRIRRDDEEEEEETEARSGPSPLQQALADYQELMKWDPLNVRGCETAVRAARKVRARRLKEEAPKPKRTNDDEKGSARKRVKDHK
jgi:hypothetical protein